MYLPKLLSRTSGPSFKHILYSKSFSVIQSLVSDDGVGWKSSTVHYKVSTAFVFSMLGISSVPLVAAWYRWVGKGSNLVMPARKSHMLSYAPQV